MEYCTVPLRPYHRKKEFNCGTGLLDSYLHKQANQDIKRKLTMCFVHPDEENLVKGYYTLSNASVLRKFLPEYIIRKMPASYTNLPVTLLGRLAVDVKNSGKGIGEILLIDALKRSLNVAVSSIGSMAVIVDPLDEQAVGFYDKYGFIFLRNSGKMFLPMKTISILIAKK